MFEKARCIQAYRLLNFVMRQNEVLTPFSDTKQSTQKQGQAKANGPSNATLLLVFAYLELDWVCCWRRYCAYNSSQLDSVPGSFWLAFEAI